MVCSSIWAFKIGGEANHGAKRLSDTVGLGLDRAP